MSSFIIPLTLSKRQKIEKVLILRLFYDRAPSFDRKFDALTRFILRQSSRKGPSPSGSNVVMTAFDKPWTKAQILSIKSALNYLRRNRLATRRNLRQGEFVLSTGPDFGVFFFIYCSLPEEDGDPLPPLRRRRGGEEDSLQPHLPIQPLSSYESCEDLERATQEIFNSMCILAYNDNHVTTPFFGEGDIKSMKYFLRLFRSVDLMVYWSAVCLYLKQDEEISTKIFPASVYFQLSGWDSSLYSLKGIQAQIRQKLRKFEGKAKLPASVMTPLNYFVFYDLQRKGKAAKRVTTRWSSKGPLAKLPSAWALPQLNREDSLLTFRLLCLLGSFATFSTLLVCFEGKRANSYYPRSVWKLYLKKTG